MHALRPSLNLECRGCMWIRPLGVRATVFCIPCDTHAWALAWVRGAVSGYAWQSDGRGTSAMATSTVAGNSKASAQPPGGAGLGMFHRSGLAASGYPPYREGDVVTCCLDQNSHPPTVRFLKNGKSCIPKNPTSAGVPIGTCLDACPMQQSLAVTRPFQHGVESTVSCRRCAYSRRIASRSHCR